MKYRAGQVVYFHHLHDDRRARWISGPDERGECSYELEGKARRMLIIGLKPQIRVESATPTGRPTGTNQCEIYQAKGRLGYLVVSVQTPHPRNPEFLFHPGLLEAGRNSYIILRPICYPTQSICHGTSQSVKMVADHVLNQIRRELPLRKLGFPSQWERK